jgi:hypothetical protein
MMKVEKAAPLNFRQVKQWQIPTRRGTPVASKRTLPQEQPPTCFSPAKFPMSVLPIGPD